MCHNPAMQFSVQRSFASGQFVRCFALLPGKSYGVGGAGFSIKTAMARCRSEHAERSFELQILKPQGLITVGMAAHPVDVSSAHRSAQYEVWETLMLERIKQHGAVVGLKIFNSQNLSISVQRFDGIGFFTVIRSFYKGKPLLSYSVRSSFIGSLLKAWEESRNPHFHNSPLEFMEHFSKSTKMFCDEEVLSLDFVNSFKPLSELTLKGIDFKTAKFRGHHIVYALDKRSGS